MELTYTNAETADTEERRKNWLVAFGLQDMDDLKPSEYAIKLANAHILGEMSINEVEETIQNYYKVVSDPENTKRKQSEPDIVSTRIIKFLGNKSFSSNENTLKSIHKVLFKGFKEFCPGEYRKADIVKAEWVLDNDTVQYSHFDNIEDDIALAFNIEENFDYTSIDEAQTVKHIVSFASKLWQIHPFWEGNTRTVAVFMIKFLRNLGYTTDNTPFEKNAKYFRNAFVRANYRNILLKINKTDTYLNKFFENIMLGKNNDLENRKLHIHWVER